MIPGVAPAAAVAAERDPPRAAVVPARAYRVATPAGVVRVFRPRHYNADDAGLVVYVHGLFTDVDRAWTEHQLPQQFAASGRNALFVVPAARTAAADPTPWDDLDALLAAVAGATGEPLPAGPLVLAGHSGAYKQIVVWLADPRVRTVLLLDGVYGGEAELRAWLDARPENRLALINHDTVKAAAALTGDVATAYRRHAPGQWASLTATERAARVLSMDTRVDHFGIVTGGRFLPLLLRWSALPQRGPRRG